MAGSLPGTGLALRSNCPTCGCREPSWFSGTPLLHILNPLWQPVRLLGVFQAHLWLPHTELILLGFFPLWSGKLPRKTSLKGLIGYTWHAHESTCYHDSQVKAEAWDSGSYYAYSCKGKGSQLCPFGCCCPVFPFTHSRTPAHSVTILSGKEIFQKETSMPHLVWLVNYSNNRLPRMKISPEILLWERPKPWC